MTARAVFDRTDELLQGLGVPAVARGVDPVLVKVQTYAEVQAQAWPPSASTAAATVYYLLTDEGDPDAVKDIISGARTFRSVRVGVELVRRLGGPIDVAETHYQEQVRLLEERWGGEGGVVACLQHPSNLRRTETQWLRSEDFSHPKPAVEKDRISLKGTFTAIFDADVGVF